MQSSSQRGLSQLCTFTGTSHARVKLPHQLPPASCGSTEHPDGTANKFGNVGTPTRLSPKLVVELAGEDLCLFVDTQFWIRWPAAICSVASYLRHGRHSPDLPR